MLRSKFTIKWSLKIPLYLECFATLFCKIYYLNTEINISQDSVRKRLKRDGIFNNHFIANLLLSVPVKEF